MYTCTCTCTCTSLQVHVCCILHVTINYTFYLVEISKRKFRASKERKTQIISRTKKGKNKIY